MQVLASGDESLISLDDIEGAKSARLMKNKEDIDVQSNFHEHDIKDTGNVPNELSARLVKNRGPITAKITASGTRTRYCNKEADTTVGGSNNNNDNNKNDDADEDDECTVQFSLVAWKFAGDKGTVHGEFQEKFGNNELVKVDVDCMVRSTNNNNEAIVGGAVKEAPKGHPAGGDGSSSLRRAYVKVVDGGSDIDDNGSSGDVIFNVYFDDGIDLAYCGAAGMDDKFVVDYDSDVVADARVSVCSKHGDWEKCLEKAKKANRA
eukprot:29753_1